MKIVGLIPFWFNKGKSREIKKLAGKYLIEYSVSLLNSSKLIDKTILYASDNKILKYIDSELKVDYIQRDKILDSEEILIEDIIENFFKNSDTDIVVLLHPYSPFLTKETLNTCIKKVKNQTYDSAFTAIETQKFSWYQQHPLNFDRANKSPKLKDLDTVISEQGLLYVIEKKSFLEEKSRVGKNPYMHIINHFEGHEINEKKDFEIAELIINSGMFHGV